MRLLGLTNFYGSLGYGYGTICSDVMEELAARGHDVTVLCADGDDHGATVVMRGLGHVPAAWRRPLAGLRAEEASQRLVRAVLDEGVDAALVWHMRGIGKGSLTLLHRAGIPVLYFLGDLWVLYERPGPPQLWKLWTALDNVTAYRWLRQAAGTLLGMGRLELRPPPIQTAGFVCFVSRSLKDRYAEQGFRPLHCDVVPNGIRIDEFAAPHCDRRDGTLAVLFAGRLDPTKGPDLALAALARVDQASLVLAGDGQPEFVRALRRQARALRIEDRVRFTGRVARPQLARMMRESDVFVMPGRCSDAFGLVYVEAMAAGAVVVGSAKGGAGEICRDGQNCLVVPDADPESLAAALERLRDDPALGARLRAGAAETAAHYSLTAMVDRVERLLDKQSSGAAAAAAGDPVTARRSRS